MDIKELVSKLNVDTIKELIKAALVIVDNMMINVQASGVEATTGAKDYNKNEFVNKEPKAGWLTVDELREANTKMVESLSTENWVQGVTFAVKVFSAVGAI